MKHACIFSSILVLAVFNGGCEQDQAAPDYSGIYCLNIQNIEMILSQEGDELSFTIQNDLLVDGTGTVSGDTVILTAVTLEDEHFTCKALFAEDLQSFSGPYQITDAGDHIQNEGILLGYKGACSKYDIDSEGIPSLLMHDFTEVEKVEKVSRFRSGFGHSFTDGTESCRSMKHYYTPFESYRENNTIEIYSPVNGLILSVSSDGHGASTGLSNKQVQIKPEDQPAFVFTLFHCDLISPAISTGTKVREGDLLGHARLYYEDLEEHATSFDIALWVNTPSGMRLVSCFDAMGEEVFGEYLARGAADRQDFIISKEARDADLLQCNGDTFLSGGNLDNWVVLLNP